MNMPVLKLEPVPTSRFPKLVDVRDLATTEPGLRAWFVDGMIPKAASILLAANGGLNKSLLMLMLGVCVALGMAFFVCRHSAASC